MIDFGCCAVVVLRIVVAQPLMDGVCVRRHRASPTALRGSFSVQSQWESAWLWCRSSTQLRLISLGGSPHTCCVVRRARRASRPLRPAGVSRVQRPRRRRRWCVSAPRSSVIQPGVATPWTVSRSRRWLAAWVGIAPRGVHRCLLATGPCGKLELPGCGGGVRGA